MRVRRSRLTCDHHKVLMRHFIYFSSVLPDTIEPPYMPMKIDTPHQPHHHHHQKKKSSPNSPQHPAGESTMLKEYAKALASVVPYSKATEDGRVLLVDAMTKSQLHETYQLVRDAAEHGQGFGADEYQDEKEFLEDIADGFQFAVMDKDSGEMVAAFILAISKFSRGCQVADPYIVVNKAHRGRRLGYMCMSLCVQFAKQLDFMGIYCDTFSNNTAMIKIIESVPGFMKVGCLPLSGKMNDGQVVGTEIYYMDLRRMNDRG